MTDPLRFNALTDPWLPLLRSDGTTHWASPVEVLCGEHDAPDLDYPRDDFRIYARLLLSAIVQALFAAKTKSDLATRIDTPLARSEIEARIAPVLANFDLFGPAPFLQIIPPAIVPDKGAAPFVFPGEDLFRSMTPIDGISLPIALVMLFVEQTYAGGAGRGYGAGPGGQPGALTLIDPGSVRSSAWANTLSLDIVGGLYASDPPHPWTNEKRPAKPRAAVGLVEGLFFQPRSIWLIPSGDGLCTFTGVRGALVKRSPFLPKSELTKKVSGTEDLWQHPCAPLAVNSQGIAAVRLSASRPAWTGLAQLLSPLSRDKKKDHPREGPAPILREWKTLAKRPPRPRLLVLDFDRDKANVKRRFFEAFPLTDRLAGDVETLERLRSLVQDAQDVRLALSRALTRAHDDRKQGGLALADAEAEFWTSTEAPFLDWLDRVVTADDHSTDYDSNVDAARRAMSNQLRGAAARIFDAHVSVSEFDPRKQARIAKARSGLIRALYPKPSTPLPQPAKVTP